jgi:diguanylate cyclase (GGDEF)-like protein/PAS domain S-box-containing protein
MSSDTTVAAIAPPVAPWHRLHAALMPDYNRKATVYWWTMVLLGAAAIVDSGLSVVRLPLMTLIQIAAGITIAMLAGFFPVRIPGSKSSFAAGETFIFLLLLLHGPEAAVLAAAAETAVGALRTSKRWTSRIFSPANSAVAMLLAGSAMQASLDAMHRVGLRNDGFIIVFAVLMAIMFFIFNTLLVSTVPRLKRNERIQLSDLMGVFGLAGIAFAASGAIAALLYVTFLHSGLGVLLAVVPIVGMLLATLHYYYLQQETQEDVRLAALREAEQAALHLCELKASEQRFHSAFDCAPIGMVLLAFDGNILQSNAAICMLLGIDTVSLRQHNFFDSVGEEYRQSLKKNIADLHDHTAQSFTLELCCTGSNGSATWMVVYGSLSSEPGSHVPCVILQTQDINARRQAEADLQQLAFHDPLTGLPNRRSFGEYLSVAVDRAQADGRQRFAMMFLDCDRFKLINDSLGHDAGDEFLVQVSQRLQDNVRPDDIVARLGGDEFGVLLRHIEQEQDVITLADRLVGALNQPFHVAGTELNSSASIGITVSGIGYTTPEAVLRDADIAMYRAKANGKGRHVRFEPGLDANTSKKLRLEGDLRRAIMDEQLALAYQPLSDLASGEITGFEALARWTDPVHGIVAPDRFIPIAEESELIVALTDFVLIRACRQLRQWQLTDPAYEALTMHVNISGKDLGQPEFVTRVMSAVKAAGLHPKYLVLELTENILMERLEMALPALTELHGLGIGLSVDDFGTGFSSLAHLAILPIDSLKVDKSFVQGMTSGSREETIVRAIVRLGKALDTMVIAEGIENPLQLATMREMGCDFGQGYHLSRPLTPEAAGNLLPFRLAGAKPDIGDEFLSRRAPLLKLIG